MARINAAAIPTAGRLQPAGAARRAGQGKFNEVLSRDSIRGAEPQGNLAQGALERVETSGKVLDEIIAQARAGKSFKPHELLAMQAQVYKATEEISLVNKVVEEGVAGVKKVWHTQI